MTPQEEQPDASLAAADSQPHRPPRAAPAGLVMAWILVGILAAWGASERKGRMDSAERFRILHQQQTIEQSRTADAAKLVARPGTRLLKLIGENEAANLSATLAWNPQTRDGAVFYVSLPPLPNYRTYHLWVVPASDHPLHAATLPPSPDAGMHAFSLPAAAPAPKRFLITAENPRATTHPSQSVLFRSENL